MVSAKENLVLRCFLGILGCFELASATRADAFPVEGKLGISGIPYYTNNCSFAGSEAEFRLKGTPWGFGATFISATDGRISPAVPHLLTGWGQYRIPLSHNNSLGLLLGGQHHWGMMMRSPDYDPNNFGIMIGASYFHRFDRFWVRATPSYTFFFKEAYVPFYPGVPWAEVGYTYGPLDFGIGLSITPIRVAIPF